MVENGKRYCKTCGSKLVKNGWNKQRKQRWKCKICGTQKIVKKGFKTPVDDLEMFVKWLLDKPTIAQSTGISRQAFWKKTAWCWGVQPVIIPPTKPSKILFIDAVYIKRNVCCIVIRNEENVVAKHWCEYESYFAYQEALKYIPEPEFVVCDGNPGCLRTIQEVWENTVIQRCLFHIFMLVRQKISLKPKTKAG
jgi:hypothetical protein